MSNIVVRDDSVIANLVKARTALAEAKTIQETKKIVDVAAAAELFAKRQQLSQENIDFAHSIKIEALEQLGRMLRDSPRASGGQPYQATGSSLELVEPIPTLADIGIDKKTSMVAQQLASLPKEQLENVKAGTLTITKALREIKHQERKSNPPPPTDKFRVIYADPPWSYGNDMGAAMPGTTGARDHYPCMSIEELCELPVKEWTEENSVLFLWVTSPLLEECFPVIDAWGFNYKTSFVWDKVGHNMGHYNSVRHEFLLVCTRGSCVPDNPKLFDSVQTIEKTGKHSQKPEEFRQIIDTLYPNGRRLEIFAREVPDNWDVWGNEPSLVA